MATMYAAWTRLSDADKRAMEQAFATECSQSMQLPDAGFYVYWRARGVSPFGPFDSQWFVTAGGSTVATWRPDSQ